MAKIFSVLTLLVALGATFLGFQSKNLVEKLQDSSKREHQDLLDTKSKLKKTEEKLKATEEELAMTKADLEKTKETLRTKEQELEKTKADLASTMAMLEETKTKLADLEKKIKEMVPDTGLDLKAQIAAMQAKTAELEAKTQTLEKEKAELTTTVETLTARAKELDEKMAVQTKVVERYKKGIMQEGVRGRVLAVNAGWGFCVLSIGDNQGAAANRIMVVARGGQAIGKVKITNVETSQSVADIIPGSFAKGTYVQPGDDVIYMKGAEKSKAEEAEGPGPQDGGNLPPAQPELPKP